MATQHRPPRRPARKTPEGRPDPHGVRQVFVWVVQEIVNSGGNPLPLIVYGRNHRQARKSPYTLDHPLTKFSLGIIAAVINEKLEGRAMVGAKHSFVNNRVDYATFTITMATVVIEKPPTVETIVDEMMQWLGYVAYDDATNLSFDVRRGQRLKTTFNMAHYGITPENMLEVISKLSAAVVKTTKVPNTEPITSRIDGDVLELEIDLQGAVKPLQWDDRRNLYPDDEAA